MTDTAICFHSIIVAIRWKFRFFYWEAIKYITLTECAEENTVVLWLYIYWCFSALNHGVICGEA